MTTEIRRQEGTARREPSAEEEAAPGAVEQVRTESVEVEEATSAPSPELKSERVQRHGESGEKDAEAAR